MKIAIVRGDFLSSWEIPIFEPLAENHDVTLFLGKKPVYQVDIPKKIKVVNLYSPVDLNFGKVSKIKMAILNRLFVDAHWLFGLDKELDSFDLIYTAETFYAFSLQAVLAKRKGIVKKVVMHVGENIPFNNEGIWGKRFLKKTCISETDKFIAITNQAQKVLLEEGAEPQKISRINPGIDLSLFKNEPVNQYKKIKKNKNIKLLIVSRLVEDKGIREMVNAFIQLTKRHKNIELIIIGKGPLGKEVDKVSKRSKIESKIFRLNEVPYLDMPKVYNLCDIFIHYPKGSKTWIEQFGFVYVEAMACGLPVVSINQGSAKEVIGRNGFVISEAKFVEILSKLISNKSLIRKYSNKSLKTAKAKYDVKRYSRDLEKIFEQTLST